VTEQKIELIIDLTKSDFNKGDFGMTVSAKVIEDSVSEMGVRITTLQIRYPRFIHGEFMTHRVFSRNASSSRAIPILTMIRRILSDMAMPIHWGANQKGMQAKAELGNVKKFVVRNIWRFAGYTACLLSYIMYLCGLHKQVANRITEPWQHIEVVVTATEWDNFFMLRDHPDAQPEMGMLAQVIKREMSLSIPDIRMSDYKSVNSWHLPYVSESERSSYTISDLLAMSAARCARVSYLTHDNQTPKVANDIRLHDALVGSQPIHASPTEHQAFPMKTVTGFYANFRGWKQYRRTIEAKFTKL
jgi:thymidylate synthase ThyX